MNVKIGIFVVLAFVIGIAIGVAIPSQKASLAKEAVTLSVPKAMEIEHIHLHESLAAAMASGGKTAEAAEILEQALKVHFGKEEEYGLPQLGILPLLNEGKIPANPETYINLSEKERREMPTLMKEHEAIKAALKLVREAALSEGKMAQVEFAESLAHHAQTEEEVFYPASILVGDYLKAVTR